jgi:enoyl-CoA hydratase
MREGEIMPDKMILTEKRGKVGLVTLNRPDALNALNDQLLHELMGALEDFDNDPLISIMVVAGNEKAFAAGADVKEMANKNMDDIKARDDLSVFDRINAIRKPVIAAVSGWALGGGCELALSCDMIIASETAKFGQPEITIGVIPGAGGTQRLARAVGKFLAMEMILNNRTLNAQEALQFGLINRIVTGEGYLDEALKLADDIASRPPIAVKVAKKMINQAYELPISDGLLQERQEFYNLFATEDQKEGMKAFIEKRKPVWKGK